MTSSNLEAVHLSISLALDLDEFEQVLESFPFVDEEEKDNTILAYENTSQSSLDSFLQILAQEFSIRKEGILRLASLFSLLRPRKSESKASRPNGIPSTLFGVLKATLIAGHGLCANPAIISAKLDRLSQRTTLFSDDEPSNIPEDVVQGLLAQLASCVVENCSRILRSSEYFSSKGFLVSLIKIGSGSEIQAFEPAVDRIDQICRDLEKRLRRPKGRPGRRSEQTSRSVLLMKRRFKRYKCGLKIWLEEMRLISMMTILAIVSREQGLLLCIKFKNG